MKQPAPQSAPLNLILREVVEDALTGFLMVQPPHTYAMCVSEGGLTTGCSGRSAARPAAEPERWAEKSIALTEETLPWTK